MKKIIFLLLLPISVFVNNCFAQFAVVSCDKLNVLYIGVDNPISVAVSNYDVSKIFVKVDSGIISGDSGHYAWKIFRHCPACTHLFIYTKINRKDSLLGNFVFRVKRIPPPILKVGGCKNGDTTHIVLLKAQIGIAAILEGFDFDCAGRVFEYEVYVNDKYFEHCITPYFSQKLKITLWKSKIKSLTFKNVRVQMCGEQIYNVVDYKLFVKAYKMESKQEIKRRLKYSAFINGIEIRE